jgi:uncharacterized damage-inducible protein DinB
MGLRERLLADYDHEVASTRRILARLPEARLAWTPHARARTLAELAAHLAHIVSWAGPILSAPSFDVEDTPAAPAPLDSRDAILTTFDRLAARTRIDMDRSDAEYQALWCLKRGGAELFAMPRESAFRAFILHHMIHHRGQLTVYLRLADVSVPAVYGPTADER